MTKPTPVSTATAVHLLSDVTEDDDVKEVFKDEALAMRSKGYEDDDDKDEEEEDEDDDESLVGMEREKDVHKRHNLEEADLMGPAI